jgi:hypothetical protein
MTKGAVCDKSRARVHPVSLLHLDLVQPQIVHVAHRQHVHDASISPDVKGRHRRLVLARVIRVLLHVAEVRVQQLVKDRKFNRMYLIIRVGAVPTDPVGTAPLLRFYTPRTVILDVVSPARRSQFIPGAGGKPGRRELFPPYHPIL